MKKIIYAALMVFCISTGAIAQDKGAVEFGVNVGYNSASVSSSEERSDPGSGINVAVAADYYFSKTWSIKGKLIYDQKGWNNGFLEDLDTGIVYKTDYNLNYVTIPVMANWHFGNTKNWHLNFGPYMGFLMNAEETRFNLDVKDGFNATDFGLAFGIGVKIPVSNKLKIAFEYEGQSGMKNIFKESNEDVFNSRWSLNVGINFLMK